MEVKYSDFLQLRYDQETMVTLYIDLPYAMDEEESAVRDKGRIALASPGSVILICYTFW